MKSVFCRINVVLIALFVFIGMLETQAQSQTKPSEHTQKSLDRYNRILNQIADKGLFENEDARVEALFKAVATYWKDSSPTWARSMGNEGYDGLWWDNSLRAQKMTEMSNKRTLEVVRTFEQRNLQKTNFLNLSLLGREIRNNLIAGEQQLDLMPVENQWGIHSVVASELGDVSIKNLKDLAHYMALLESADQMLLNAIEVMKAGVKEGMVKPKEAVNKVSGQLVEMLKTPIDETAFFQPVKELPDVFEDSEKIAIARRARGIIEKKIMPAYQLFKAEFDKEYYPNCRESIGFSELPNGENKYKYQISYHTTTRMTAKEIHEQGLREVERIRGEMENIIKETGFDGDFAAFNEFLKTDPQFFYTDGEDLLEGYRVICKRIDPELIKFFGKLPRTPYGVKAIPDYLEKAATTAYYSHGSYKTGEPGYFYANTYALDSRPKWEMEALTLHEAVPGHHLQIALADEIEGQPEFRKFLHFTAYVEGWALYAESLGSDIGLYQDPYSKYGQLTYEIWRAIRLVVDTGIHAFGWSKEEAVDFFAENSPRTKHDIEIEVNRYISWPGQALGYKIGELKIQQLRAYAQGQLGNDFDLRSFHDLLLEEGAVPLEILEQMVQDWVTEQKNN